MEEQTPQETPKPAPVEAPDVLVIDDSRYQTRLTRKFIERVPFSKPDPRKVTAVIPGVIQDISVRPGQQVRRGDSLLTLEAMKMRNEVSAPHDGTVKAVLVQKNERVMKNQLLIEFE